MSASLQIEKVTRPELAKHDSSILDLVFIMDCTGSMGAYIASALENIRSIVEEIVVSEKSDIYLALVEYRDHPPQDHTFVTRVHDFTAKVSEMKRWLEQCGANGGGDGPEAVADGLHDVLKLSWRAESTKICILIADAAPHGLDPNGDGFPNGCPCGLDPVEIIREMVKKNITLYVAGVEPSIVRYRDFFMSLAYITGGQYVPMINAKLLAKVIIGGVREEISLDRLMQDAQVDIDREMRQAEAEGVDEKEKIKRMHNIFTSRNLQSTHMTNTFGAMSSIATDCFSKCTNMSEMQSTFSSNAAVTSSGFTFGAPTAGSTISPFGTWPTSSTTFTFGGPSAAPPTTSLFGMPTATPSPFTFVTSTNNSSIPTTASSGFTFGGSSAAPPTTSLFGTSTNASTNNLSIPTTASSGFTFGGPSAAPPTTSLFGTPTNASTNNLSIPTTASSGFTFSGPSAAPPTTSLFGMPTATPSPFTFGTPTVTSTNNSSIPMTASSGFTFSGSSAAAPTTSLFGTPTDASTTTGAFTFSTMSTAPPTSSLFPAATNAIPSFTSSALTSEPSYELIENNAVTEDQAARMFQRWQNRQK